MPNTIIISVNLELISVESVVIKRWFK